MVRRSPWELPQVLLALAHRQGGCVTAAQAAAAGLNANAIARRMLHGRSRRHLGCIVLVAGDTLDRHALDAWAMTLRLQPLEVVVSGSTALHLRGRHPPAKLGDCMIARVARATKRRLLGVILMAQRHGDRTASRSIRGLLVHHPTQALLDIIATVAPDAAQAWLNWALHERLLTEQDLRREVARVLPRRGGGARTESVEAALHEAPSIRPTAVSVRARQGAATLDESPAATPSGSANVVRDSTAPDAPPGPLPMGSAEVACGAAVCSEPPGSLPSESANVMRDSTTSVTAPGARAMGSARVVGDTTTSVASAGQRARGSSSVVGHSKTTVTPPARIIPVRAGTKGAQARTRLHMALNHVAGGTRSEAERRLTRILRAHRIRGIRANWPVALRHDAAPIARIDLAHPATKLAIEVDGRAFHSSHEAFEHDRERQGLLAELGWLTIRFTWSMLASDPARVAERVRSVIASRAAALRTERCRAR
jgi:very-short-patch-repair endonuclease